MMQQANAHAHKRVAWKNRYTFMLATAGSAIGLGNIWKLPYMIGVNGGSAFVLVFIACIFFVGIPLMMTEILLGRRAQKNTLDGMAQLAREAAASKHWRALGGMGMLTGLLILGFYNGFDKVGQFIIRDGGTPPWQFNLSSTYSLPSAKH